MRRICMAVIATTFALPLGCSTTQKVADTTVQSAKTAGGTTRGLVTGGTSGAKKEYETGVHETDEKTSASAEQTPADKSAENIAATTPSGCQPIRVFFAFDSSELTDEAKAKLDMSATCLEENQRLKVSIQGNTDERGTNDYNHALGDRRARLVEEYLSSKGVSSAQLGIISFGENNPLCQSSDEECWKVNRRAAIEPACRL